MMALVSGTPGGAEGLLAKQTAAVGPRWRAAGGVSAKHVITANLHLESPEGAVGGWGWGWGSGGLAGEKGFSGRELQGRHRDAEARCCRRCGAQRLQTIVPDRFTTSARSWSPIAFLMHALMSPRQKKKKKKRERDRERQR